MRPINILLVALCAFTPVCSRGDDSAGATRTRFGTYGWFRASTGNTNFITGKVYSQVDSLGYAKLKRYNPLTPGGTASPLSNEPRELARAQPDIATRAWWVYQLEQMQEAGLDFIVVDTMGKNVNPVCTDLSAHPDRDPANDPFQPQFAARALSTLMSDPKSKLHLKVSLIVESGPAYHAFNWERMGTNNPALCPNPYAIFNDKTLLKNGTIIPMPITPANVERYYYELSTKPFFANLDHRLWLTHNGKSLAEGGRPVIFVYNANESVHSNFGESGPAWKAFKELFKRDYGVEPFLIISQHWFAHGAHDDLKKVADGMNEFLGEWVTGKRKPPGTNAWELNGFRVAAISPGVNAEKGHWGGVLDEVLGKRWKYVDGTEGADESYFLTREWDRAMSPAPNLALIGFLDDYTEGQQFTRMANYLKKNPSGPDDYLPPDYYIKKIRHLIDTYHAENRK